MNWKIVAFCLIFVAVYAFVLRYSDDADKCMILPKCHIVVVR